MRVDLGHGIIVRDARRDEAQPQRDWLTIEFGGAAVGYINRRDAGILAAILKQFAKGAGE